MARQGGLIPGDTTSGDAALPAAADSTLPVPGESTLPVPGESTWPVAADHSDVWTLVTRAQAGDLDAFGVLYSRYAEMVHRFIYYRVHDRALAEDFTSDTFLRALRRIGSVNYRGRDIGAWLITIARNIVLDHAKSARTRLEVMTAVTLDGDTAPSPESAVIDAVTSELLLTAISALNNEQGECVTLRYIRGFTIAEAAAQMGKTEGAIKALQHRAVRKLAELVGDELR